MRRKIKQKPVFYSELAYAVGLVMLAIGTSFMEYADFGLSMVVAPAYLIHLKVSQYFSWFTFGVAEYTFQLVILIIMSLILRRFRLTYLFSFVTAFLYGTVLDLCMIAVGRFTLYTIPFRIFCFLVGMVISTFSIALFFHTYITPEAYELLVKELSEHFGIPLHKFKMGYDITSLIVSIVLSFIFFGWLNFVGINVGTIICSLTNGYMIYTFSRYLERIFEFKDRFALRKYFE